MRVSLLITCLADNFYPRSGIAVVKVLEKLGCEVDFPSGQTCCGQPMWNNGFVEQARPLAQRLIRVFEGSHYIVTPSGSCAAMIREYYTSMFEGDPAWNQRAAQLVEKTYEFTEFLVKVLKVDLRALNVRWSGKVTYHYSCHLRGIGMTNETTQLLDQIDGLEFVPLDKADQCCGFGGTFAMKYPQISGSLVQDKADCIRATGASVVVSNDAGCTMNMAGYCHRHGDQVQFKSLAEILAEGLGLLGIER